MTILVISLLNWSEGTRDPAEGLAIQVSKFDPDISGGVRTFILEKCS